MSAVFFFSSRRRHTRLQGDWSSDVCSSDLEGVAARTMRHAHASPSEQRRVAGREIIDMHSEQIVGQIDRKSTRLNSSHLVISYAVFCLKKKKNARDTESLDLTNASAHSTRI